MTFTMLLMTLGCLTAINGLCMMVAAFITLLLTVCEHETAADEWLFAGIIAGFTSLIAGLSAFLIGGLMTL